MQIGSHLAGMAIENAMLGVCHSCANPLTAHYGLTHGVAIGLMLPHVVRFNAGAAGELYAQLAKEAGLTNAEELAARLAQFAAVAGLPRSLKDAAGHGIGYSGIVPHGVLTYAVASLFRVAFAVRGRTSAGCAGGQAGRLARLPRHTRDGRRRRHQAAGSTPGTLDFQNRQRHRR